MPRTMSEANIETMENLFRTLVGIEPSEEIKFNRGLGRYWKGAERSGATDVEEGVFNWYALLTRAFSYDQLHSGKKVTEMTPEDEIKSVKFGTGILEKSTVVTKINPQYGTGTIEERIKHALKAQEVAKELLTEKSETLREYLNFPLSISRSNTVIKLNGEEISVLYRPPRVKIVNRLGQESYTGNFFEASATRLENLSTIITPLDYQIQRFKVAAK